MVVGGIGGERRRISKILFLFFWNGFFMFGMLKKCKVNLKFFDLR